MAEIAAPDLVVGRAEPKRSAWILWLATALPTLVGLALIATALSATLPSSYGFPGFTALFSATFATVGGVVLARRPGNSVALVLLAVGAIAGGLTLATGYAYVGLVSAPGSLPFAPVAAWLMAWIWLPLVLLAGPVLLGIFPDGHFLSSRWRLMAWGATVATVLAMAMLALRRGPLENFPIQANPFGVLDPQVTDLAQPIVLLPLTAAIIAAAVSLIVRYRRSDRERQHQLKWIAVAAAAFGILSPLGFTAGKIGQLIFIVSLCAIPIAAGIAVLRYRLYEIDTIINRAIVYGLLTAVLAGIYTASVGLLQRLSQAVSGTGSEAAVVLTTVVIVATFTPIKNRLQRVVDRRFRENVDVAARLEAFAAEVRARIAPLDERRALRRFLEIAIEASGVPAGRLELDVGDEPTWSVAAGDLPHVDESGAIEASALAGAYADRTVRLTLIRPKGSARLPPRDEAKLQAGLQALLQEFG